MDQKHLHLRWQLTADDVQIGSRAKGEFSRISSIHTAGNIKTQTLSTSYDIETQIIWLDFLF